MSGLQPLALHVICPPGSLLALGFTPRPCLSSVPEPTGLFAIVLDGGDGSAIAAADALAPAVACAFSGAGAAVAAAAGIAGGAAFFAGSADIRSVEREHASVESAARNAAWVKVGLAMRRS